MTRLLPLLVLLLLTGCPQAPPPPAKPAPVEAEETEPASGGLKIEEDDVEADLGEEPLVAGEGEQLLTFGVDGFHCANCAKTTYGALIELEGVVRARVSYDKATVWIVAAGPLKLETLAAAVKAEGFTLKR